MKRRPILTVLLITCFLTVCGRAGEAGDIKAKIVEFGTFVLGPGQPGTRQTYFTAHGDVFTARLGLHFGFRFTLNNVPDIQTIDLQTVVTHPPITDKNGQTSTRYELITTLPVSDSFADSVTGYSFDRPGEMTPGVWTFTHSFHGRTVVTKSFTIRAAKGTG